MSFLLSFNNLPNRALLKEQLDRCIEKNKRQSDYRFAVLMIDLDNFKVINDSLGHRAGDDLLVAVAGRLRGCLRTLDGKYRPVDDTVARLGGDEFAVLLDGLRHDGDALVVAQRIQETLTRPYEVLAREVTPRLSLGITSSEQGYEDPEDMLRDADTALGEAKAHGKGRVERFDAEMRVAAVTRMEMEIDLQKAISQRQLELYYQPIVSLTDGAVVGFEGLIRWHHPTRGFLAPNMFIDVAEETGLIVPVGAWVLREACQQGRAWRQRFGAHPDLYISVNLSPRQMADADLLAQIDEALRQTETDPRHLKLEITESVMVDQGEQTTQLLDAFKQRGLGIYMDDFGTGYSSLSYLHTLPIDVIKIDRSFVMDMDRDTKHANTIQAVVSMARNRDLRVVAEGVESPEQLFQLQSLDCDLAQGYFFSRPRSAEQAEQLLENGVDWLSEELRKAG